MNFVELRKMQVMVERAWHDGGPPRAQPIRRGTVIAVIRNPHAGRHQDDLITFMEALKPLASRMARDLLDALGGDPKQVETYGKGAIVGIGGEIEHAALWHSPGGAGLRDVLGGGQAPVPGNQKMGLPGTTLDVPMGNVDAPYVRSHYDSIPVMVGDAPRSDEILLSLAFGLGGRVHARLGGTTAEQARQQSKRP